MLRARVEARIVAAGAARCGGHLAVRDAVHPPAPHGLDGAVLAEGRSAPLTITQSPRTSNEYRVGVDQRAPRGQAGEVAAQRLMSVEGA